MALLPLKPALTYFGLVFAAGFVLGTVRVIAVAPVVGEQAAEILEIPLMVIVSWLSARLVIRRFAITQKAPALATGVFALGLLLLLEFTLVLQLRGLTIEQYFTQREPLALAAYFTGLLLFGLMPRILVTIYRH
ncbi:MAG: hypothetical protein HKO64_01805 [Xanthomonadales bacterium]|nr:hypothetical protein [Xanthomonadales bacterium]